MCLKIAEECTSILVRSFSISFHNLIEFCMKFTLVLSHQLIFLCLNDLKRLFYILFKKYIYIGIVYTYIYLNMRQICTKWC